MQLLYWAANSVAQRKGLAPVQFVSDLVNAQDLDDWNDVATLVPGRAGSQCKSRYLQEKSIPVQKCPWTPAEDELLRRACQRDLDRPWAIIALEVSQQNGGTLRTSKQCRERWKNHLSPDIKK